MITCDTMDTEMSIQQTMELANVGCEIVRITAPTVKDSGNLENIVKGLRERGCNVPIVADIHFKTGSRHGSCEMGGQGANQSGQLRRLEKVSDSRIQR